MKNILIVLLVPVLYLECSEANINDSERTHKNLVLDKYGHLKDIPRKFELSGKNVAELLEKYVNDIERLALSRELSVVYKIKVELHKPKKDKRKLDKIMYKKKKSKKFNVPLKIENYAKINTEHNNKLTRNEDPKNEKLGKAGILDTTEPYTSSTKKDTIFKYKPIPNKPKIKFGQTVKPVKIKSWRIPSL